MCNNKLRKVILRGDRALIKHLKPEEKTSSELYILPGGVQHEKVLKGHVVKTGTRYDVPGLFEDGPWKVPDESVKYVPLQAKEGGLDIFYFKSGDRYKIL
jgi:co-chaperonin GroES (HSP10)